VSGSLFCNLRDRTDDIFANQPPPKPSRGTANSGAEARGPGANAGCVSGASGAPATAAGIPAVDIYGRTQGFNTAFNNADNPCFHADALVRMADGSCLKVSQLAKGMHVAPVLLPGGTGAGCATGATGETGGGGRGKGASGPRVRCVVRTDCPGTNSGKSHA
jgi:hypothetical protein